ncbi:MAG: cytochrome c [Flavobacteriaceae bacterium]|nr:cytochrome c [Flavobacteriaceae bacterium]
MRLLLLLLIVVAFTSCKIGQKKDTDTFQYKSQEPNSQQEEPKETTSTAETVIPIDLKNKGIGTIKRIRLSRKINQSLSEEGKTLFNRYCTTCHLPNQKLIGPILADVFERRSPEWIMNLMLNPAQMLSEDPIAIALLKEYNVAMYDQGLNEDQARAILEYMRTL